jgi:hypothetical protein
MARHIFQACPVWIYTQSNITRASYSPVYITPTQQISCLCMLFTMKDKSVGTLVEVLRRTRRRSPNKF